MNEKRIADRLDELSNAIAQQWNGRLLSELTMRVPAEPERDADLVLAQAAKMIREHADLVREARRQERERLKALLPDRKVKPQSMNHENRESGYNEALADVRSIFDEEPGD